VKGSLVQRLRRYVTRRRERRVGRERLLVALGCDVAAARGAAEAASSTLAIELPTLQYWIADRRWNEWRTHIRAGGRVVAARLAVAAAQVARPALEDDVIDSAIDEALVELHAFTLRADAAQRERLSRQRGLALRIADGTGQGGAHGAAAFAHAVANGVHTVFEKDYAQRCRVAWWNAFVATWGQGPDDVAFRRELLAAARRTLEPWARDDRTDPWPELDRNALS